LAASGATSAVENGKALQKELSVSELSGVSSMKSIARSIEIFDRVQPTFE
jgi:hypothetical protein